MIKSKWIAVILAALAADTAAFPSANEDESSLIIRSPSLRRYEDSVFRPYHGYGRPLFVRGLDGLGGNEDQENVGGGVGKVSEWGHVHQTC